MLRRVDILTFMDGHKEELVEEDGQFFLRPYQEPEITDVTPITELNIYFRNEERHD